MSGGVVTCLSKYHQINCFISYICKVIVLRVALECGVENNGIIVYKFI